MLGFGSVSIQDKKNKTHHYRVRDKKNLEKIIHIFNGNLYTEYRIKQFSKFLYAFNLKYNENIIFIENKQLFNLNNAWLSGFTDAEGCLTLSIINRNNLIYPQIQLRYIISQKNELKLFNIISKLLKGRISILKSYNGHNLTVNYMNLKKIINYLEKYPLKTKKKVTYVKWKKVYIMMKENKHKTIKGLEKIKRIKKKWRESPNF